MNTDDAFARQRTTMVADQIAARGVRDARVLRAMERVPRHLFVPKHDAPCAYEDRAMPIGCAQTISQPYMVALMCELLDVEPHHRVLEVGAGSGYQAAVLAQLAAEVYAVEIVPELVTGAQRLMRDLGYDNVHIQVSDGTLGLPEAAPFDRIIVAAAAPAIPPPLVDQLVGGGRIVAPVGSRETQTVRVGTKLPHGLETYDSIGCVFVPLRGRHGWPDTV